MTHLNVLRFVEEEIDWVQEALDKGDGKWPYETKLVTVEPVSGWEQASLSYVPQRNADGKLYIGGMHAHVAVRIDDKHLFDRMADQLHDAGFLEKANPIALAIRVRYVEDADHRTSRVFVREDHIPSQAELDRLWTARSFEEP